MIKNVDGTPKPRWPLSKKHPIRQFLIIVVKSVVIKQYKIYSKYTDLSIVFAKKIAKNQK